MNVKEALKLGTESLKKNSVSEPQKSADFLLRQIFGWEKAQLFANTEKTLTRSQEKKFLEFIKKRSFHQPVWYITGKIDFYDLTLSVNEDVLIPRPETEFLVEKAIKHISYFKFQTSNVLDSSNTKYKIQNTSYKILDLGTGSGAIALAIAEEVNSKQITDNSKIKVCASDVSVEALKVAKLNAKNLGLEKDVEFRLGNLLEPWEGEKFDMIVANLPYIPHEDMSGLALDIHHWEPRLALDGGSGGLEIYEKLLKNIGNFLNPQACLFFEIGIDQGQKISELVREYLPGVDVKVTKDYSGVDRIVEVQTP